MTTTTNLTLDELAPPARTRGNDLRVGRRGALVEVFSPANSAHAIRKKISQYQAAGVQVVWVVYPTMQLVEVHRSGGI
jgi:hypothetical protein